MQEGSTQQRDIFFKLEVYRVQKMKHELYYRRSVEFSVEKAYLKYLKQTHLTAQLYMHVTNI